MRQGLQTVEEVKLFIHGLKYGADSHYRQAVQALDSSRVSLAQDPSVESWVRQVYTGGIDATTVTYQVIGKGYLDVATHLEGLQPSSLTRAEMQAIVKQVFPRGRAAEDLQDNALELFDKLVNALKARDVNIPDSHSRRLLDTGYKPGLKPPGDDSLER